MKNSRSLGPPDHLRFLSLMDLEWSNVKTLLQQKLNMYAKRTKSIKFCRFQNRNDGFSGVSLNHPSIMLHSLPKIIGAKKKGYASSSLLSFLCTEDTAAILRNCNFAGKNYEIKESAREKGKKGIRLQDYDLGQCSWVAEKKSTSTTIILWYIVEIPLVVSHV